MIVAWQAATEEVPSVVTDDLVAMLRADPARSGGDRRALNSIDSVAADRLFYSGKLHKHEMRLQDIAGSQGGDP